MGRRQRRAETSEDISDETWGEYIRLSRKCPRHVFSAYQENYCTPTQTLKQAAISRGVYDEQVLQSRIEIMKETHNTSKKLGPAFPSAPFRSSKWGFYIQRRNSTSTGFQNFGSDYSARHFLDFLIDDKPVKWLAPDRIVTDGGVEIRCEQPIGMEDLLEQKLNEAERSWEPPSNVRATWQFIRDGKSPPVPKQSTSAPQTAPQKRSGARTSPKTREGLVTLGEITSELKIDPRDARVILRKSKMPKPDAGWAWSHDEVDAIKKILQGGKNEQRG